MDTSQLSAPVRQVRLTALLAHAGLSYGDRPYIDHLDEVVGVLMEFGLHSAEALMAGYLHDAPEDTGLASELVWEHLPFEVAVAVDLVTDEHGINRKERKAATYAKVLAMKEAAANPRPRPSLSADPKYRVGVDIGLLVKLADRIANLRAAKAEGKEGLVQMYRKEATRFREVYKEPGVNTTDMWAEIGRLLA